MVRPIAENAAHPEFLTVKPGSLDDPRRFVPASGSSRLSSAQPWHHIDPSTPRFEKNPF